MPSIKKKKKTAPDELVTWFPYIFQKSRILEIRAFFFFFSQLVSSGVKEKKKNSRPAVESESLENTWRKCVNFFWYLQDT